MRKTLFAQVLFHVEKSKESEEENNRNQNKCKILFIFFFSLFIFCDWASIKRKIEFRRLDLSLPMKHMMLTCRA